MPFARLMFWSVAAGSIDELAQYLYICADVAGHYFDFNDIFLNAQGSVAGLLIRYGYKSETDIKRVSRLSFKDIFKRFFNSFEGRISIAAASMVFILFLSGFIRITPPGLLPAGSLPVIKEEKTLFLERHPGKMGRWNRGPVGRYYIMTAFEGTLVTIIYVMFFCSLALFYRSGKSIKGSYNMKG